MLYPPASSMDALGRRPKHPSTPFPNTRSLSPASDRRLRSSTVTAKLDARPRRRPFPAF